MNTSTKLFLGWTVAAAICLSGGTLAQSNPDMQRAVVVKLRVVLANGGNDTAAGLFVGKDQQNAYFITANHALRDSESGPEFQRIPARIVELQFLGSPQTFKASILANYDEGLDLGVVSTAVEHLPPGLPKVVRKDVTVGALIYILGHPPSGFWSVWPGNIQNENGPNGDVQHFITNRDASLIGGYSGGPVFDSNGNFVGMHISTQTGYGIAAKSLDIVRHLQAWQVPTNNLTEFIGPPTSSSDVDAIKKILSLYQDAYNHKDATALWGVWPNVPIKTKRDVEASFSSAASIRMTLQPVTPEIAQDGANAIVSGQFSEVYTPRNRSPQSFPNQDITFVLRKVDGSWSIVEVK
jgi:hypothetical protein